MKKLASILILTLICNSLICRNDSTKIKRFGGFYVNLYYPIHISNYYNEYGKYSDDSGYQYDLTPYRFQTPGIGVGYVLNLHPLFVKTDINYWYGSKFVDNYDGFKAENVDGSNPINSFASSPAMSIGSRYYSFNDHVHGNLNLHNIDLSFALGCNIFHFVRLFVGFRANFLPAYNFNATMDRDVSLFEVVAHTSPYSSRDSLIEVQSIQYKDSEVKKRNSQVIGGNSTFNVGVGWNFNVKKHLFLSEVVLERNIIFASMYDGPIHGFITFKLGYFFKYSVYFGKKKTKD